MIREEMLDGTVKDKVAIAIDRLRSFEPPEGYYLAFSGGKDSQTIYHLAQMAGVKFDAHHNLTTVDPPELIYFIRRNYPDVIVNRPRITMWQLIEKRGMLPTRSVRFCCTELKERGGNDRFVVTGIRWQESVSRGKRNMIETCGRLKSQRLIHPIIDWTAAEVWEFLGSNGIEHCQLYDEGFKRIGCVLCPFSSRIEIEMHRWPAIVRAYQRSIRRGFDAFIARGGKSHFSSGDELFEWWIRRGGKTHDTEGQGLLFEGGF